MQNVTEIHWDLSELHDSVSVEHTQPIFDSIQQDAQSFSDQYKGRVDSLDAQSIHAALLDYDRIRSRVYQLSQFAHLHYAVDVQDADVLKFMSKVDEFSSDMSNMLMFFFLEIGVASVTQHDIWAKDPVNEPYTYVLSQAFEKNKYRLSEKEEQLVNLKDLTGVDALKKMYGEHTARYEFKMVVDGHEKIMNGTECRALRYHHDPVVRRDAMALFFKRYEQDEHLMVQWFNSVIKDYNVERIHRGYSSPISCMNIRNDLPDGLVDMLHDITSSSNGLVQRYYRLKKQVLGLDKMTLSDIYAPMGSTVASIPWDEAKGLVLDSFSAFDDDFYRYAKDMFDSNRLDVFPSKVKRGGAFCSSSRPDVRPYVMLNYLGKQRDIATLAHELGHAIHAYFSSKQPLINYHAILPVCETASVFCEMLVVDALKKTAATPDETMVLLATKLEDIFATSHRQHMFSCFEQEIHHQISTHRLSGPEIKAIYAKQLSAMFGDSVDIPLEYHWEWAAIPHMLDVPFYVYSYNFGNLLVLGLYQMYLDEGVAFVPKLKRILSSGSSVSPVDLMANEGIDILSQEFWMRSIRYIDTILDEFESVVVA